MSRSSSTRRRVCLPFVVGWHGFVLARDPIADLDITWWTLSRGEHLRYEIAGRRVPRRLVAVGTPTAERSGRRRLGRILRSRGQCLSCGVAERRSAQGLRSSVAASRTCLRAPGWRLCSRKRSDQRRGPGRPVDGPPCRSARGYRTDRLFMLRRRTHGICEAITTHRLTTPQSVGQALAPAQTAVHACRRFGSYWQSKVERTCGALPLALQPDATAITSAGGTSA